MVTGAIRLIVRAPAAKPRRLVLVSEEAVQPLPTAAGLTPRENEVLRWLAAGKTNGEIATILTLARGTVNRHVERIFEKLGAENRTAAATIARAHGLVASR